MISASSLLKTIPSLVKGMTGKVLDLLLPPQCLICGELVSDVGALCAECWNRIRFLGPPYCRTCGQPFELDSGIDVLCNSCVALPPAYRRARAVMRYDDASRVMLLRFKHGDRTDLAVPFGRWLARAGAELILDADVIIPVPLHRWRLFTRKYNQAGLLAQEMTRHGGPAVENNLLRRVRHTPTQGGLDRHARTDNVGGAFVVTRPQRIAGLSVLLIDDVFTTGATVSECARVLRQAGARSVDVLALARVVRS